MMEQDRTRRRTGQDEKTNRAEREDEQSEFEEEQGRMGRGTEQNRK